MKLSRRRILRLIGITVILVNLLIALQHEDNSATRTTGFSQTVESSENPASESPLQRIINTSLQNPGLFRVTEIHDGDTITVEKHGFKYVVRLIGIDTPESHDPRKPVQCYSDEATAALSELLHEGQVRLEADPADSDKDKYGRLLRYAYLPDGTLVNAKLIEHGYGFAYVVFPYGKQAEFISLEQEAEAHRRGLWSHCRVDDSNLIKQTNPV